MMSIPSAIELLAIRNGPVDSLTWLVDILKKNNYSSLPFYMKILRIAVLFLLILTNHKLLNPCYDFSLHLMSSVEIIGLSLTPLIILSFFLLQAYFQLYSCILDLSL